jgi:hypothetical protein
MLLRDFSAIVYVLLDHLFAAVPNPRLDRGMPSFSIPSFAKTGWKWSSSTLIFSSGVPELHGKT